jgi:nicotinamidase-related amidase
VAPQPLPLPLHYDPAKAGSIWKVPYQERAAEAERWRAAHGLRPAHEDRARLALLIVDAQNTFCLPEFELFVGGRSGSGAVDDNRRLAEFIYRNLGAISRIIPTLDTHQALQIFHALWLVDADGRHPPPYTLVSIEDIQNGRWRFNPVAAASLGLDPAYGQRQLEHYARQLKAGGKYNLTIWPYHAMLGGIGHALVSLIEEAVFFHAVARFSQPDFQIKGNNPLTEHYSVLGPEVRDGPDGEAIADRNERLIDELLAFDAVVIAGQAKSHCVAWTIDDLLRGVEERDRRLARKVYLLEDCCSPVVVPGVIDYTDEADRAFARFAAAGMHVVRSTEPVASWPDISL